EAAGLRRECVARQSWRIAETGDRALDAARVPLDLLWREPLGWNLSSAAERVEFDEVSHPPSAGDPDRQLVHSSRRNSRVEAHYRGCGRIHAFAITPSASLGSFTAGLLGFCAGLPPPRTLDVRQQTRRGDGQTAETRSWLDRRRCLASPVPGPHDHGNDR